MRSDEEVRKEITHIEMRQSYVNDKQAGASNSQVRGCSLRSEPFDQSERSWRGIDGRGNNRIRSSAILQ
jgi:hypothetical protein